MVRVTEEYVKRQSRISDFKQIVEFPRRRPGRPFGSKNKEKLLKQEASLACAMLGVEQERATETRLYSARHIVTISVIFHHQLVRFEQHRRV